MTTAPPTDVTTGEGGDPDYDAETELLRNATTELEAALDLIDKRPGLTPSEQLATLAVAGVKALVPVLRDELDRRGG